MQRDVTALANHHLDLLVVGAGAFGSCVAWDACLRGLRVGLIDAGDFGHATSANCYKVIHGGIRYLQHADIPRLRASARERSIYFRIAPHLTSPLPVVVPTYGYAMQGKPVLRAGLSAYDLLTIDRNRHIAHKELRVPGHGTMGRDEVLSEYPGIDERGLTGAAIFNDGQMYSPERLVLAFVKSCAQRGAVVANYVRADSLLRRGSRVEGVCATDLETGDSLDIRADMVVNTAGPWAEDWLGKQGIAPNKRSTFSRDAYFVVNKPWQSSKALAVQAATVDPDAVLARGARHLFCMPWRDQTIVGVWHKVWTTPPETVDVPQEHLQSFVEEVNSGLPSLNLTVDDVAYWNAGLVLFGDTQTAGENLSYGKRSRFIDHLQSDQLDGLLTLIGVRYTTARAEAEKLVDFVGRRLDKSMPPVSSHEQILAGGHFDSFAKLSARIKEQLPDCSDATHRSLLHNYGAEAGEVLAIAGASKPAPLPGSHVLEEELRYCCRREMATRLQDLIMRRTEIAAATRPGSATLDRIATIAGEEHGWTQRRREEEVVGLNQVLDRKRYPSS